MQPVEELLSIPVPHLLAALAVTFFAAAVQGTIGVGFSVFSVPILSLVDPRLAPVPQLLLSVPLTVGMAYRERHAIDWRSLSWVLVGRIPGAVLGVWLLVVATAQVLDGVIGACVLAGVLVFSTPLQVPRNRITELVAGVASGIGAMVAAIGGPPLALLYRDAKGETIRANLGAIFAIGLLISIVGRALAGRVFLIEVALAGAMLPALFAGLAVSGRLLAKIEGPALRIGVLAVSALAAVALLLRALAG